MRMAAGKMARRNNGKDIIRLICLLQFAQNATVARCTVGVTMTLQLAQLRFQHIKFTNTGLYMKKVLVYQVVNHTAICIRLTACLQQHPDFFMGHIQRPTAADKHQSFQMGTVIVTVVICLVT